MTRILPLVAHLPATPLLAADSDDFDPASISEVDAINCHLDVPGYNGFAFTVTGEDDLAGKRHWRKIENGSPLLSEHELPAPIAVTGSYATHPIAFTSSGIVSILDLAGPAAIAQPDGIANVMDAERLIAEIVASAKATRAEVEAQMTFRKFLGERVLADAIEPPGDEESFGTHIKIARTISDVISHPGQTFYGCTNGIELLDKEGKPL